jgi:hypothetical protein
MKEIERYGREYLRERAAAHIFDKWIERHAAAASEAEAKAQIERFVNFSACYRWSSPWSVKFPTFVRRKVPTSANSGAATLISYHSVAYLRGWCPGAESNHRHCDFQSHALPTELPGQPGGWP